MWTGLFHGVYVYTHEVIRWWCKLCRTHISVHAVWLEPFHPPKIKFWMEFFSSSIFPHCLMLFTIDLSFSLNTYTYTCSPSMSAYIQRNAHIHGEMKQSNDSFELSSVELGTFSIEVWTYFLSIFLIFHSHLVNRLVFDLSQQHFI